MRIKKASIKPTNIVYTAFVVYLQPIKDIYDQENNSFNIRRLGNS